MASHVRALSDRTGRAGASPQKFERGVQLREAGSVREPIRGLGEQAPWVFNIKILLNLEVPKRVFGEPEGARLPRHPGGDTPEDGTV